MSNSKLPDQGLQPQRTYQAWSRTLFSAQACTILIFKNSIIYGSLFDFFSTCFLLIFIIKAFSLRRLFMRNISTSTSSSKTNAFFLLSFLIAASGVLHLLSYLNHFPATLLYELHLLFVSL